MNPDPLIVRPDKLARTKMFAWLRFVAASLGLFAAACAFAGPGAVDTTFNVVVNGAVNCAVVQASGKIVIAGAFNTVRGVTQYGFARLNPDGALDTNFFSSLSPGAAVYCMLVQPDGKCVLGGQFTASLITGGGGRINVARFNPDGTLDNTFTNSAPNSSVYAVAQQPDGKILIGGQFNELGTTSHYLIARLNTDGTMDNSFNAGQISGTAVNAIAVQNDGNILVGGNFTYFSTYGLTRDYIARLTTNGAPDINYAPYANSTVQAVYLEPSGKSVWAGSFTALNNFTRQHVGRLNTDGSLDTGFTANIGPNGTLYAVAEDAYNQIYVGGQFQTYSNANHEGVARVFQDGTLDTNFNNTTSFNVPLVRCLAIQGDGRVIAGGSFTTWGTYGRTNLVQLYGTNYPAEITTQFKGTNVTVGGSASFSVTVSNPTPVNYQWYLNGAAIPSATNNQYSILSAQLSDAGAYTVRVSAGMGATTSLGALLQVTP